MEIKFSKRFGKQFQKIKDKGIKEEIIKKIKRLHNEYLQKKHLRNVLGGNQVIRTKKSRIIYEVQENIIEIKCIRPRKKAYR